MICFGLLSEEDVGNDVGGVAVNDLVEQIGGADQTIGAGPAADDVTDDPCSLASIFGSLELITEETESAGKIWVGHLEDGTVRLLNTIRKKGRNVLR